MTQEIVDLGDLRREPGMPGLTISRAASFVEAAAVCFEQNGYSKTVEMAVELGDLMTWRERTKPRPVCLEYPAVNDQIRKTNNDLQDAAEEGACAVAIAIVHRFFKMAVLERTRKGCGFDYWIGQKESEGLQGMERLEVSGILKAKQDEIEVRVKKKLRQVARGSSQNSGLPQCIVVVEFSKPESRIVRG
jgi:hypothetical protein